LTPAWAASSSPPGVTDATPVVPGDVIDLSIAEANVRQVFNDPDQPVGGTDRIELRW
jgi:hypothetical protein